MDVFDGLKMLGGLCLFLFGMNLMGQALERRAGNQLKAILAKLTNGRFTGFLTGCAVTALIQSSSATTVMVVGFVNSGLMSLRQAIYVIMGANVGTTVTSWLLALAGIDGSSFWLQMLKPASFTPLLALVGIILYLFTKGAERKDIGVILLGFSTLMTGMETMSTAVSGLAQVPAFRELFLLFQNPLLGLLVGALLTALIQSSSASVGILQALSMTGQVTYGTALPIIMGQNIGTCVTALLSAIGAGKNAKRAAFVHLAFNLIGSLALLGVFVLVKLTLSPPSLQEPVNGFGIAVVHSVFNVLCVLLLMPLSSLLEKLAVAVIRDGEEVPAAVELDERLLAVPPLALQQCRVAATEMACRAVAALEDALDAFPDNSREQGERIRRNEALCDQFEDSLGTYLVKLSGQKLSENDSEEATKLLKTIGDLERISDHGVNILELAEELRGKKLTLSEEAYREYQTMAAAIREIMGLTLRAFTQDDLAAAAQVEPLEEVIDELKERLRTRHILRMQEGKCSIAAGFVWADLLTNLERSSDHCSNIAGCVLDTARHSLKIHETLRAVKSGNQAFVEAFQQYAEKYALE
ncbi:MAG: Na/Pi cotransporter family protein [Ruminiclostridium sp.]|jgi:phosphate:Na+ symporter|nr:Na/Pi cotransporter family protein [Ruminiclostridium sp.]MCI9466458.1 Na/Pi cotransporter family protein [Ruminiclostridium sp.]